VSAVRRVSFMSSFQLLRGAGFVRAKYVPTYHRLMLQCHGLA
jgi:hypothetical protein